MDVNNSPSLAYNMLTEVSVDFSMHPKVGEENSMVYIQKFRSPFDVSVKSLLCGRSSWQDRKVAAFEPSRPTFSIKRRDVGETAPTENRVQNAALRNKHNNLLCPLKARRQGVSKFQKNVYVTIEKLQQWKGSTHQRQPNLEEQSKTNSKLQKTECTQLHYVSEVEKIDEHNELPQILLSLASSHDTVTMLSRELQYRE